MSVRKITEELDFIQKKAASLREIYRLYPDTVIRSPPRYGDADTYLSHSINKDVDAVRFAVEKSWLYAYTFKIIGNIQVCSIPEKFGLCTYFPGDIFTQLIVQNYLDSMLKQNIPENLIRECDLQIISFIKERNVNLTKTNLHDVKPDTTLGKLLALL